MPSRQTPSLRDFGLAPETPRDWPHARHHARYDESGARPLPTQAFEGIDDDVELPVRRSPFGVVGLLVSLAVGALALLLGLYLGGVVGGPRLNPTQAAFPLTPNTARFDEWMNENALAQAHVATVRLSPLAAAAPRAQEESTEIEVIDETPMTPASRVTPEPRPSPAPRVTPTAPMDPLERVPGVAPPVLKEPEMPPLDESGREGTKVPAPAKPTAPAEIMEPAESEPD